MHVILAFLGVVVTVLVLLYRLADVGIDLGGLNPFAWRRRRAWRQKVEGNPIFSIEDPKEIAALLVVGVAKIDGEVSGEEKRALLSEFQATFGLEPREASQLVGSSAYLLGDAKVLTTQLEAIVGRSKDRFNAEQVDSLLAMMERIASIDGAATMHQRELIEGVRGCLAPAVSPQGTWG